MGPKRNLKIGKFGCGWEPKSSCVAYIYQFFFISPVYTDKCKQSSRKESEIGGRSFHNRTGQEEVVARKRSFDGEKVRKKINKFHLEADRWLAYIQT